MTSTEIRSRFLKFFENKLHTIVPSAPMVVKNDPTLMFTNAGMNQFKDIFLGNSPAQSKRVANSQKCLRVSGKHNDLEEVGIDTYHHTMFEMLGNWSFGDYFKKEAIAWAWEFLTEDLKIDRDLLYVTVFEGSKEEGLESDQEAYKYWLLHIEENRIIYGSKKDNFWEMGDTGPCGPCSEIHIDLRSDDEKKKIKGRDLVNTGNPQVIEIWNLVFIQYNRKANGALEPLPDKHVDTGMGFERLCRVVQGKKSNYDTDIFMPVIGALEKLSGHVYGEDEKTDIAMRVVADHIRAVAFAIADGELPSNTGAGYVIRRILRRAVRYGYTYLGQSEPFIYKLLPVLAEVMGNAFPELKKQQELVQRVIREEEVSFLRTLETGIRLLEQIMKNMQGKGEKVVDGKVAFKLFDTYGFPLDLTQLILREKGFSVDTDAFAAEMEQQKSRSRQAAVVDTGDWVVLNNAEATQFVGYDVTRADVTITRYRTVKSKNKQLFQLVFDVTPFYAESGGQVGDCGMLKKGNESIAILNTVKENNLIIHIVEKLPVSFDGKFEAVVDLEKRLCIENNHSATHLMHHALRSVLGKHVEQKGSLVNADYLRFDFSHFQKMTKEEIRKTEKMVNAMIRENITLKEFRNISFDEAKQHGAMALFGEKYGDTVRMIKFGDSVELCGGTHVPATGKIGVFKIVSEGAIAAGIRRIEAVTGMQAEEYFAQQSDLIENLRELLKGSKDITRSVQQLLDENTALQKQIIAFTQEKVLAIKDSLKEKQQQINGVNVITAILEVHSADAVKDLAFKLKQEIADLVLIIGVRMQGKANLAVMISDNLVSERKWHAGNVVREAAKEIDGSGGGQPFYAMAGGKNPSKLDDAIKKAKQILGLAG